MSKEEWIKGWTTGKFESANKQVIRFIADFLYRSEDMYDVFASGYCYYFALMLKAAFNRGEICWHRGYGHIVWVDDDNTAYDIGGVFYDYNEGDLLPVEDSLADMIVDFKHTGEEYRVPDTKFHDWITHYKMTDVYAVSDIYKNMPKQLINDNHTVYENVWGWWICHKKELSEYYAERKHEMNVKETKV